MKKYFALVTFVGLILSVPLLIFGFPAVGDSIFHYQWQANFTRQFFDGDLYPRWLLSTNAGYGSPDFLFYGPVPFYVGTLVSTFLVSDPQAWQQLGISSAISLCLSGIFAFLWLRHYGTLLAAAIGAILYMAFPYHLLTDLYVRGAYGEFWAFTWLPLILYFSRAVAERSTSYIPLALSYSALVFTHLPTTLIFSPVAFCYGVFCALKNRAVTRSIIGLGVSYGLGIALSAIFWFPAITLKKYTESWTDGPFNYAHNFVFINYPDGFRVMSVVALSMIVMFLLVALYLFLNRKNNLKTHRDIVFWSSIVVFSIFMMTRLSAILWELIPVIQSIPFPWRFHVLIVVAMVPLLTIALNEYKFCTRDNVIVSSLLLCLALAGGLPLNKQEYWDAMAGFRRVTSSIGTKEAQHENPFHLTKNCSFLPIWALDGQNLLLKKPHQKIETDADVIVQKWSAGEIQFRYQANDAVFARVGQLYFPGWRAFLEESGQELSISPDVEFGLIRLQLPPEGGHVTIRFRPQLALIAAKISGVICLSVIILVIFSVSRKFWISIATNKI